MRLLQGIAVARIKMEVLKHRTIGLCSAFKVSDPAVLLLSAGRSSDNLPIVKIFMKC